jgi:hypothetical protein
VSDIHPLFQATLSQCAAQVGPMIGLELESGEIRIEPSAEPPQGERAVLPVAVELDDAELGQLELSCPISEIATLARRMLGDEEPDKVRELSAEDQDAIGEVLNLMSGAIDQSVREHLDAGLHARPLSWWRSDEPGENAFAEGEHLLGRGSIDVPGGGHVEICLRVPPGLLEKGATADAPAQRGCVLLVGLEGEQEAALRSTLEAARQEVCNAELGSRELGELAARASAIMMAGEAEEALALSLRLRRANRTWSTPIILCLREPTRDAVIRALESGASHVLCVPADDTTLLRVLQAARA